MAYLYLAVAFFLNAVANILLKLGAREGFHLSYAPTTLLFANWRLILGAVLFAVNVFFYFLALRALPLSIAYPAMVIASFLLINSYAIFALGESLTILQLIGYAAIVIGLFLVVANAS